ncbi:MAG: winged helix-turn-helix domain-containing protein [Planctomycetota bacterium]
MKNILFSWTKGGVTRLNILRKIYEYNQKQEPIYTLKIASEHGKSGVAVKKHLKILIENNLIKVMNPNGKPKFLEITNAGRIFAEDEILFDEICGKKRLAMSS